MQTIIRGDQQFMPGAYNFLHRIPRGLAPAGLILSFVVFLHLTPARAAENQEIKILELQGTVEIMPQGAKTWVLTQTNQVLFAGDRARTAANSRVTLRWSDQSIVPFGQLTEIEILPPPTSDSLPGLHLFQGIASFFHRDTPGRIRIITHGATASIEGTEFVMEAGESNGVDRAVFSLIDGQLTLSNELGAVTLTNNQSAMVETGKAPVRAPGFIANNLLQWCFYYPAIVDLRDLELPAEAQQALRESLAAYRSGDLLQALAKYPASRQPQSDSERIYHAALFLAVGQVAETEAALRAFDSANAPENLRRLADALRTLIAAVKRQPEPTTFTPKLASEYLAKSYYEQSRANVGDSLRIARSFAEQAAKISPEFGFAWVRLAELEFGFGRTGAAAEDLRHGLELSPRNAQALALQGFILAAQNRTGAALKYFNQSLVVDGALGNAWLGRGLCRIRSGDSAGREDLLVAAAQEPQRSLLRSYLGKAYANVYDDTRANRELMLALKSDPADPTGWLYLALLQQQENQVNDSIENLEKSQSLNDNRRVFRSRMLLDQDKAVRSANLASVYRDAGMTDVSVREAARAVAYDYDDYSAHLFLAESYDALRDPTRFNLRYETVWFNELLLANLLSPVGAGRLAQNVSEQEYSRLLESDGFGIADTTTPSIDEHGHQSINELASQFGTFGGTSYSLDLDYQHNDGVRINNGLDSIEWYTTVKQQVTPDDTAFGLLKYENYHSGDNFQYYNQTNARPNYHFDEYQSPIMVAGWHHQWAPGVDTLFLGGRLINDQDFHDANNSGQILLFTDPFLGTTLRDSEPFGIDYRGRLEIYTAEVNQIFQSEYFALSAGARYQQGDFKTSNTFTNPPLLAGPGNFFPNASDNTTERSDFRRVTGYGYLTLHPCDQLWLTGGAAYEDMSYPQNFRNPPLTAGQEHRSQLGPKASLVWEPLPQLTVRGIYSESLGGVSLDESYRLEPTQLAGFPQTFRSLIPESLFSSTAAPEYKIYGGAIDLKLGSRTYAGLQIEQQNSKVERSVGYFLFDQGQQAYLPASTRDNLDYRESIISASVNQLLGEGFAAGLGYKWDLVRMSEVMPSIPVAAVPTADQDYNATLQEYSGYLLYNHPSGFFASFDATWYHQHNSANTALLGGGPGDNFVQENVFIGWRFLNRRLEAKLGVLDLSGGDYHLFPLNTYAELPRERTYVARLSFIF